MIAHWRMQLASDVVRDGLGLELLDESGVVVAEVFRCDADHTVTIRIFFESVSDAAVDELVEHARVRLEPFEDGRPLPVRFSIERAV
jgi:hypothetical protein